MLPDLEAFTLNSRHFPVLLQNSHDSVGRKAMTNLDSVLKRRDITVLTKICIVKAMVFLVWFSITCTDVRVRPKTRLSTEN